MDIIINSEKHQINSERRRLVKLSKVRQRLSSFHLTKKEIDKILKFLRKLGYLRFVKPGLIEVLNDDLWVYLCGRENPLKHVPRKSNAKERGE